MVRVNLIRCFAILLGLSFASPVLADFGQDASGNYVAPSKWNHFNNGARPADPVAPPQKQTRVLAVTAAAQLAVCQRGSPAASVGISRRPQCTLAGLRSGTAAY